jgi:hypothetical protein
VAVHGFYRTGSVFLSEFKGFFLLLSSFFGVLRVFYLNNSFLFFLMGLYVGGIFYDFYFAYRAMGSFFFGIINYSSSESPVI